MDVRNASPLKIEICQLLSPFKNLCYHGKVCGGLLINSMSVAWNCAVQSVKMIRNPKHIGIILQYKLSQCALLVRVEPEKEGRKQYFQVSCRELDDVEKARGFVCF